MIQKVQCKGKQTIFILAGDFNARLNPEDKLNSRENKDFWGLLELVGT